ncbi:MAG TPA: alkaline phosphatase family protein [Roseiarcus sp.]|jgi:phospholipase C|nr:alkaline phosphatase family protein [Roseiarcus sp.]
MKRMVRSAAALAAIATLSQPALAASSLKLVTTQPDPPSDVAPYFVAGTDPRWTAPEWSADDIAALRQEIKYVFVIFNENRSFDHEYGTLPGVNGLYSDGKNPRSPADTAGFTESYLDTNTGETVSVQPFRSVDGLTGPISGTINGETYSGTAITLGPPLVEDPQPWWGSEFDNTVVGRLPAGAAGKEWYKSTNIASNLTFATLPLTFMGGWINWFTDQDRNPAFDLPDVAKDVNYVSALGGAPVQWRWYQNGYDHEPTDAGGEASHQNYVSHHNGAQYFGYIANNPAEQTNLRGEGDFFSDIRKNVLPRAGGVFYIRGGYYNLKYPTESAVIQNPNYPNKNGLTPTELAAIKTAKSGDDDHPSYSDSQLSESMAARVINAIAANQDIWEHSAIVITYDESDGLYDHVAPEILSYAPDGLPLARGIRIPLLLISPYARVHAVSHAEGDHNAVIETINALFGLPALSSLPDEKEALAAGDSPKFNAFAPPGFEQKYLGPRDAETPTTASLLSGFDKARITGALPPLPGAYAMIPEADIDSFPHYGGKGCAAIGVTPEDVRQGIQNLIPEGFNSLPATLPAYN